MAKSRVVEAFHFAVGQSSLGKVLLATSDKGVIAILIGDDVDQLHEDLQQRFPDAHFVDGGREANARVASVIEHIETPTKELDLPARHSRHRVPTASLARRAEDPPSAKHRPTRTSPASSAPRKLCGPWARRAPKTCSRSRFRATGYFPAAAKLARATVVNAKRILLEREAAAD